MDQKVDKSENCDKITLACRSKHAEVAELADALRSGRSGHTLVRVQIPPSALDLVAYEVVLFNTDQWNDNLTCVRSVTGVILLHEEHRTQDQS